MARVQTLYDSAYKAMRMGDEATAKTLLQEKATVTIALTKAESRVEANSMLAAKLDRIIGVRQTKLVRLYSAMKATGQQTAGSVGVDDGFDPEHPWPTSEGLSSTREDVFTPDIGSEETSGQIDEAASRMDPGHQEEVLDDKSMGQSQPGQQFSSEEDLAEAFLNLERKTLERMLEISPDGDGEQPPNKGQQE